MAVQTPITGPIRQTTFSQLLGLLSTALLSSSVFSLLPSSWAARMTFQFERLLVYQKSVDFADDVCSVTEKFSRGYGFLVDQLNRAALRNGTSSPTSAFQTDSVPRESRCGRCGPLGSHRTGSPTGNSTDNWWHRRANCRHGPLAKSPSLSRWDQ